MNNLKIGVIRSSGNKIKFGSQFYKQKALKNVILFEPKFSKLSSAVFHKNNNFSIFSTLFVIDRSVVFSTENRGFLPSGVGVSQ